MILFVEDLFFVIIVSEGERMKAFTMYFLRHGKTWFNEKDIVQGWCDSLLTDQSIQEAKEAKKKWHEVGIVFDRAYVSPTLRTRQTLFEVAGDVPYTEMSDLMEIHYGFLEGESAKTLQLFYPNRYDFEHFNGFAGGENWQQAGARFKRAIDTIVEDAKDGEKLLIVTHGAIMTWFLHQIDENISSKVPNLCLCEVQYQNGKMHIEKINA